MNKKLIQYLEVLKDNAAVMGEVYRERAYKNAIDSIKSLQYSITLSNVDSIKIKGVGVGIQSKIVDFLKGKKIKVNKSYDELSKIVGVGPSTARRMVSAKIYTLRDLKRAVAKNQFTLTHAQKLGLTYYNDLLQRIPRAEITRLSADIKSVIDKVLPGALFVTAGSYRRGSANSGDIDILISTRKYTKNALERVENVISSRSDYIDKLSIGEQRYTFLIRSPYSGVVRQIDILYIKYESYFASILYFTGSGDYNVGIRAFAKSKGYKLNQNGLYKGTKLIPLHSEEDLYAKLGIKYDPPTKREKLKPIFLI